MKKNSMKNTGGDTGYYNLESEWKCVQDIIECRGLNYSQGNILKVAMTMNVGRHDGTTYQRDLEKVIWFANRELKRMEIQAKERAEILMSSKK